MMSFRAMLGAAGIPTNGGSDWSLYNATNDKAAVIFSNTGTALINVVPIDDTRALLVYRSTSFFTRARIASVDGSGDVTFGTETVILSAVTLDIKADLLDSTHAIIAVESGGAVKCIAIEFSGTSIDTVGSAVNTETVNSNHVSIAGVSSSAFYVAYEDNGDTNGTVFYATVSGTTITMGNGIDFETLNIVDLNMCKLANDTCLIGAGHGGANDGEVYLISQSANTPQVDDQITLVNGSFNVDSIGAHRIDDNTAIFCWTETASTTDCTAAIITESGGTLAKGTNEQYSTDVAEEQSIALPNNTQAVITMGVNSVRMQTTVLEIDGTSLNALTTNTNVSGDKEFVTNGAVGTDTVLMGYEDDNDGSKGKIIAGRV